MFRLILYVLGFLLFTSVIRAVWNIVAGSISGFDPSKQAGTPSPRPSTSTKAISELKKDPVCGTFIAAQTAIQKSVGGETYYFCSDTCRDAFTGP